MDSPSLTSSGLSFPRTAGVREVRNPISSPRFSMSLSGAVISILLVTTILIQAAVGYFFYHWQYVSQYRDLQTQLEQVGDQAAHHLAAPIWNYDDEQAIQILHNFMLIPSVSRIAVSDESGKKLFEQKREPWKSLETEQIRGIPKEIHKEGKFLGAVEVEISTAMTSQRMREYLMSVLFSIIVLTVVLIVTLYVLLNRTIVSPIRAIENYATGISSRAALPDPPTGFFTGELASLRSSIIAMVTALLNSEKSYRSIFENSLEGIFQTSIEGSFIKVNSALANILGYSSPDELQAAVTDIGRQLHINEEKRQDLVETIHAQGFVVGNEIALRSKDGRPVFCLISMYAIRNTDGTISHFEGSLIDISKRKQAEEQLADLNQRLEGLIEQRTEQLHRRNAELVASEERYRNLVETIQEGIFVINATGQFTYVNRQMSAMLGLSPEEMVGKECSEFTDHRFSETFREKLESVTGQSTTKFEMTFNRTDGHSVQTLVSPTALYENDGHYRGSFAVVTDISALKQLQTQLLHAQKLESIGQLAAGIAHEINTPTQYVINNARFLDEAFAEILEVLEAYRAMFDSMKDGRPDASLVEAMVQCADRHQLEPLVEDIPGAFRDTFEGLDRIANIVSSIKRFAHPGQDITIPSDLNEAIRSTITVSTNEWKYVADIETDLDPDLPPVPCILSSVNQVILNLIVNAAQSIAEKMTDKGNGAKGKISIQTRNLGDFAEIRVGDSGGGIPENIRNRVFDPFFTTKEVGKGTGQGLAIARNIITETHHGSIDFETELGHGSTFIIRLPLTTK